MNEMDKKETKLFIQIYDKTMARANAKLTEEEKALLEKYGLERNSYSKSIISKANGSVLMDERTFSNRKFFSTYKRKALPRDVINFADKARKLDSRIYARRINANYWGKSFIEKERATINSKMQEKHRNMCFALSDYKCHVRMYNNLDAEYDKKRNNLIQQLETLEEYYNEDKQRYTRYIEADKTRINKYLNK